MFGCFFASLIFKSLSLDGVNFPLLLIGLTGLIEGLCGFIKMFCLFHAGHKLSKSVQETKNTLVARRSHKHLDYSIKEEIDTLIHDMSTVIPLRPMGES